MKHALSSLILLGLVGVLLQPEPGLAPFQLDRLGEGAKGPQASPAPWLTSVGFRIVGTALASPLPAGITVSGTLVGRSGKPLAKAWVCLGRLSKDEEGKDADLVLTEFSATADDSGRFQIKGVAPGPYTLVYRPAPGTGPKAGAKIGIRRLSAVIKSFMPAFRDREVGATTPFDDRPWPTKTAFTLMKGHTLYCAAISPHMRIWNATVRSGLQGPYLEMRKNIIWRQDFQKDTQLKFEAWSF